MKSHVGEDAMPAAKKSANLELPDDAVLAQTRILWSLGDWNAVAAFSSADNNLTNDELALYIAAAWYQLGQADNASQLLKKLTLSKTHKELAAKLLVSGVFNALAKASACSFEHEAAEQHFSTALSCALPHPVSKTLLNARATEQMAQLGLPRLADNIAPIQFNADTEYHLTKASLFFAHEAAIQVALAEYNQQHEQYDQAIVHWQNVSSQLNTETPQLYYDRLKEAYKAVKGFPSGTVAQESLTGDTDKHQLLAEIHKKLQPQFYFEIGVQTGKSLALAQCEAIGVDPMPLLSHELGAKAKVITASSDAFFARQGDVLLRKPIDLCFIDGMHLFEYVLRDFINVERYAKAHTLIVIDDIYPGHPDQAKRDRCTRAWTGDVWKLTAVLQRYRPDLFIQTVDAYPTGLMLITALDPNNNVLSDNYQAILQQYSVDTPVPDSVIKREGAVSGKSTLISQITAVLHNAKQHTVAPQEIKQELVQLVAH
jgi:hypothetical protein